MPIPLPYQDQFACRDETLEVYASDRRGTVEYRFNNFGYRNDIDYSDQATNAGVYIGSSITAGIGVDWHKSFAYLCSHGSQTQAYHFAQGCKEVDNQEIVRMLDQVLQSGIEIQHVVLQFINLDRRYDSQTGQTTFCQDTEQNIQRFLSAFDQACTMLVDHHWCFFGCDGLQHQLPDSVLHHPNLVSWNPRYLDLAGVGLHPGEKWHKMIAMGLLDHLKQTA